MKRGGSGFVPDEPIVSGETPAGVAQHRLLPLGDPDEIRSRLSNVPEHYLIRPLAIRDDVLKHFAELVAGHLSLRS
jgi:hypothetical protein